jgi:membrane-anchored protein YejM (alkaline phosphatase superfamily)
MGMYAIPIIIYQPGVEPKEYKQTAQQCDILPTALHLLHYTGNYSAFGTDLYDRSRSAFAVNYANNNWQLITDSSLLQFDGNTTQGYFKLAADSLLSNNLAQKNHSLKEEKQLKSVLQQYRQALLHNSLIKR